MGKPRRTRKQREIMGLILQAAGQGVFLTPEELHAKLSYTCTFGAARVSIRFLMDQGMLEKQNHAGVRTLVPTASSYDWFRPLY